MILDGAFKYGQIAQAAKCSRGAVQAISANLKRFGTTTASHNGTGRPKSLTPKMLQALREHLTAKPDLYLDEMAWFVLPNLYGFNGLAHMGHCQKSRSKIREADSCS